MFTSSFVMAGGRSVKMLMAIQERNHINDRALCWCRNEKP